MENSIDPKYQNLSRKERMAIAKENLKYIDIYELGADEAVDAAHEAVEGLGFEFGEDFIAMESPWGVEFVFIDDLKELGIEIEEEKPKKSKKNKKKRRK